MLRVAPAQRQLVHRLPGTSPRCRFVCTTLQCCRFVCTTLQCCRFVCTTLQCCHFVCTTLQCCHFGHFLDTGQPRHGATQIRGNLDMGHTDTWCRLFSSFAVTATSRTEVILSCHGVFVCQDTPSCILHGPATFCPPGGRASHTLQVFLRGKSPGI